MTVAELIALLEQQDPGKTVYTEGEIAGELAEVTGVFGIDGRIPYGDNVYLALSEWHVKEDRR